MKLTRNMEENNISIELSMDVDVIDEIFLKQEIKSEVTNGQTPVENLKEDDELGAEQKNDEIADSNSSLGQFEKMLIKKEIEEPYETMNVNSSENNPAESQGTVVIKKEAEYDVPYYYSVECNLEDVKIESEEDAESYGIYDDITFYKEEIDGDQFIMNECAEKENTTTRAHNTNLSLTCNNCNFTACTLNNLKKHIRSIHVNKSKLEDDLQGNQEVIEEVPGNRNIEVVQDLTKRQMFGALGYHCNICDYKTKVKKRLAKHVEKHLFERFYYVCYHCCYCTTEKRQLVAHIKEHFEGNKCKICYYEAPTKSALTRHLKTHNDASSFQCHVCNFRTVNKALWVTHVKRHNDGKFLSCNICNYTSVTQYRMKVHIRNHSEEKPFTCDICNFKSKHKPNLTRHVRKIHTGEQMFSCNVCFKYRTYIKGRLDNHILCHHSGRYPFRCELCPYKAKRSDYLKNHMKKHSVNPDCTEN